MDQKSQFRDLISQRIAQMTAKDRAAESRSVCRRGFDELSLSSGDIPDQVKVDSAQHNIAVCSYSPIDNEVDITLLNEEIIKRNIPLYFPRMENGKNVFRRVQNLKELKPGSYGILEPVQHAELLPSSGNIIAIIPGRAFTRDGGRLGRGNGGYDHWIGDQRKIHSQMQVWGVCFECQLLSEIPLENHDQRMDAVITARGKIV